MHKSKRFLSWILAGTVVTAALSGCGGKTSGDEPVEISIISEFNTPSPPDPGNSAQKLMEEKTNTKLDFMWQSAGNWGEKLNILLAAGDIPDLTKITSPTLPSYLQMAEAGAFWDVGPYIKDYPHLMEYPEEVWKKMQYEGGKQYLIPSVRPLEGSSFYAIRKDWLDKLGLDMPKTTDELYEALKAFKENDMNGNGKLDTIPFAGRNWLYLLNVFTMANDGGINQWKEQDGVIVDMTFSDEMIMGIEYLQKLYAEGLMIPEFASMKKTEQEDLAKGNNVGMNCDTVEGIFRTTEMCRSQDPAADFCPFTYIEGPLGKYVPRSVGVGGGYVIPKKTVSEEKLKKILEFMDFGASEEGFELACWGIEGEHFTKDESGFRIQTDKGIKDNVSQSSYGKVMTRFDPYLWAIRTGMDAETYERNKTIIDGRSEVSTPNSVFGLVSKTLSTYGTDYGSKKEDVIVRVIMGEPMSLWLDHVETLKNDEVYMKITDELNAAYAERNNTK